MNAIPKTVKTYTVKCFVCDGIGKIPDLKPVYVAGIKKYIWEYNATCETCKGRGVIEILNR